MFSHKDAQKGTKPREDNDTDFLIKGGWTFLSASGV